jgi:methionyl-tRNA formyltransferase
VAIDRLIRAFDPWPVAQTQLDGASLRLWGCDLPDLNPPPGAEPGQVIGASKAGIAVATGAGVLRLTRLQPPGKRPMSAAEFLNARRLDGVKFG